MKSFSAKIEKKAHNITSFSGIFFVNNTFNQSGLSELVDRELGIRKDLEAIPGNRVPSADTLLRGIRELAVSNTEHVSSSGKTYQFNFNEKLNQLNIESLLLTNQLQTGKLYDFDYDNQFIEHDKYDSQLGYKKKKGYFPGIATLGDKH